MTLSLFPWLSLLLFLSFVVGYIRRSTSGSCDMEGMGASRGRPVSVLLVLT
jgi:hypothetical protein